MWLDGPTGGRCSCEAAPWRCLVSLVHTKLLWATCVLFYCQSQRVRCRCSSSAHGTGPDRCVGDLPPFPSSSSSVSTHSRLRAQLPTARKQKRWEVRGRTGAHPAASHTAGQRGALSSRRHSRRHARGELSAACWQWAACTRRAAGPASSSCLTRRRRSASAACPVPHGLPPPMAGWRPYRRINSTRRGSCHRPFSAR